jgi:hypothetical protein
LGLRGELCAYFEDLGDPWCVWALPDVDEEVVGDFPEDEEYQELQEEIMRHSNQKQALTLNPYCTYESASENRLMELSRPFSCVDS